VGSNQDSKMKEATMSLSRRRFVQTVGAGAAGMWVAGRGREAGLFDLGFESLQAQTSNPIILASNENPLGPGRAVLDAVRAGFGARVLLELTAGVARPSTERALQQLRAAGVELVGTPVVH
jgi:hypothetical protein